MKDVEIFNSPMFGELRVSRNEKGEHLFCLADVCKSLALKTTDVVKRIGCDPDTIGVIDSMGRNQNAYFITEPDLYRVIFQSRKPTARKFQDWVFDDVLPTLRKEGTYSIVQPKQIASYEIEDPIERAKRWIEEQQQVKMLEAMTKEQEEQIQKSAPKVDYYDQTLGAINYLTPTQIGADLGISARELNKKLKEAGIIYFQSGMWNLYSEYKRWNLASTRTFNRILPDGNTVANVNLVWNQRGKRFILALFNNDFDVKAAIAEINGKKQAALAARANNNQPTLF